MLLSSEKKPLDIEYANQMRSHPYGTALYKPQPHSIFHPGMVGYFNDNGDWNPIIDLSKPPQKSSEPATIPTSPSTFLPLPSLPTFAPPDHQAWGPKLGTCTRGRKISLSAGVSQAVLLSTTGVPLSLGACYRFESEGSTGAVLITSAPVVHERCYHEMPFKRWVVDNAKLLLKEREELKKCDLWVVTSIWSAEEVAINCWRNEKKTLDVGFKVGFVEIGEIAPKGEWVNSGEVEGWLSSKGDETSRRVAFFGGLRFKYRPVIGGLRSRTKRTAFRGDEGEIETVEASVQAEDGIEYELACEAVLESDNLRSSEPVDEQSEKAAHEDQDICQDEESDDDW